MKKFLSLLVISGTMVEACQPLETFAALKSTVKSTTNNDPAAKGNPVSYKKVNNKKR